MTGYGPAPLLAVIAGGKSRRFGRDKTQLEVDGTTLLERCCALGITEGLSVAVIGRERPDHFSTSLSAVAFLPDARPGLGPLGGISTALPLAQHRSVIAVAADMPAVDRASLAWLRSLDDAPATVHARIPGHDGALEPLCALYRPTILPMVDARLDRGELAVHALADEPGVEVVAAPAWLQTRLVNINTPADWDGFRSSHPQ